MMRRRVVVYGLGTRYLYEKHFLENEFQIVALSDREKKKNFDYEFVEASEISSMEFDYIYITSTKYFEEIKNQLINEYHILPQKIMGLDDVWWKGVMCDEREEWIRRKISNLTLGKILLDAGAGNQKFKRYCSHLNYISQDFGEYDIVTNREQGEKSLPVGDSVWQSQQCDIISDITTIPLPDSSVDVVLCTEVFEHIVNPIAAVKEFSRLIKEGGELYITAPVGSLTHMAPYYYSNGYSKYWYETVLPGEGFILEEIISYGNWFTYMERELVRMTYMAEKYGKKLTNTEINDMISLARILLKQSENNRGSEEILCHGYMVSAKKEK